MKDKTMRIVLLCSLGAGKRNSGQTQRVVGEHNIFGETLSQALGGSKITVTTLCPRSDRYWNGSWHEPRQHAQHDDYGCKVDRPLGYRAGMAGKPVHVAGIAKRAGSPVDQVSAELAGAGLRSW